MVLSIVDYLYSLRSVDIVALLLLVFIVRLIRNARPKVHTTKLRGPPSESFYAGAFKSIAGNPSPELLFDKWKREYGHVFSLPMGLGYKEVVVGDVKGVTHVLGRDTFLFWQPELSRVFMDNIFGRGILSVEHDHHRRIRKALTPAFSNAAIRGYVDVFNDHSDKLRSAWDALLEGEAETIEVQQWMNNVALENIGVSGFSHQFGALEGNRPKIIDVFEAFQLPTDSSILSKVFFLMGPLMPFLLHLPTENTRKTRAIRYAMKDIADGLLEQSKAEMEMDGKGERVTDKSMIGLLIKAESAAGGLTMTSDEVLAQMNTLFFAGYETTSTSLTWALIELCKNPEVQSKLRQELREELQGADPTWEQITLGLPYLDAVTQETLRVHAAVTNLQRVAQDNDIIPLSKPITTASGDLVSEIVIAEGTLLNIPLHTINVSEELWGPDAHEFKPERWLGELSDGAKSVQGHHHLMTFSDGPRFCLGRHFALANFKTTLANMVKRYSFELPYGKDTPVEKCISILPRPKVVGEKGARVPLKVKRVD